ncbi:flagellar basal body-associated FliL family protein [Pseudorhodoferax sp.]|uniref:flagellar basal body-associated FliL family protein n=1 Tax=Pseudorhodoferax sp. TaxID=1993553 RepID=UPI002DD6228E|nr:flagellar basal body-associated FliL family protein [Pseudorhodoferax sp.]
MTKGKLIAMIAAAVLLTAGAAGGGFWWWQSRHATTAKAPPPPKPSTFRYVTLDKIIVMLRSQAGDPLAHYMAVDVVFKADDAVKEKAVKDQLPLLRSVTVKALSEYTLDKASALTIEQLTTEVNAAYKARYTADDIEQPFAEALISKLIIE